GLDRVDAGLNGLLDSGGAVRVRGNFAAESVSFGDNGANLVVVELLGAGRITFRQNAAGRRYLDDIGSVLDYVASLSDNGRHSISNAFRSVVEFGGEQADIDVAAGGTNGRP